MFQNVIFLVCVLSASAWAQPTVGQWNDFLSNPSDNSYQSLMKTVGNCTSAECLRHAGLGSQGVADLVHLIGQGNPQAIDLGFLCRRLLSGGNLEDVTRALAGVVDTNPKVFLERAKTFNLSPRDIRRIVKMLPSNAIDDDQRRLLAMKDRVKSLRSVMDANLLAIRDVAIDGLEK